MTYECGNISSTHGIFQCELCPHINTSEANLKKHMENVHKKDEKIVLFVKEKLKIPCNWGTI